MHKMLKSKFVELIDEQANIDNQKDFSMFTYRTSKKNATMIELMSIITQKSVASLFTTMLSEKIASKLLENDSNIELLNEYFGEDRSDSGFVKLLVDRGLITREIDSRLLFGDLDMSGLSEEAKNSLKELQKKQQ